MVVDDDDCLVCRSTRCVLGFTSAAGKQLHQKGVLWIWNVWTVFVVGFAPLHVLIHYLCSCLSQDVRSKTA